MTPIMIIQLCVVIFILYLPTLILTTYFSLKLRNLNKVASIQFNLLKEIKSQDPIYFKSLINKKEDLDKEVLNTLFYGDIE